MLGSSVLLLLLAALGNGAVLHQRDDEPSDIVKRALEEAGVDINLKKIDQVLAIGDSYTAGIGSNGEDDMWNNDDCSRYHGSWPVQLSEMDEWERLGKDNQKPFLTFGACSGNVMEHVRDRMLEQGDALDTRKPWEKDWPYTPIGKPQIAVMTISGNDVQFSRIVNSCIMGYFPPDPCVTQLEKSKAILDNPDFRYNLTLTYAKTIAAGRTAGGADPPESFQLYAGGYVGLFNYDDAYCDNVYWGVWYGFLGRGELLDRDLRRTLNDMTDQLNGIIADVAKDLEPWGVIHVDGYNSGFIDSRFCEYRNPNCIHDILYQDKDDSVKIWSYKSPFDNTEGPYITDVCNFNDEHPHPPSNQASETAPDKDDTLEIINDILVPDPEERQKLRDDKSLRPWNVSQGNWDQYPDLFEMIKDRSKLHDDPAKIRWKDDYINRMFHPKRSGYKFFADEWMKRIIENHNVDADTEPPPPVLPPPPTKALTITFQSVYDHTEGESPDWVTLWFKRTWLFYEHNIGDPVGCFNPDDAWHFEESQSESKEDEPAWPSNPEINSEDFDDPSILPQGCFYRNDGTNAGRLFCPDFEGGGVNCKEHEDHMKADKWYDCGENDRRRAAVVCEW